MDSVFALLPLKDGSYKEGHTMEIKVTFSGIVGVTGTPSLLLETGETNREASYTGGTGTETLTFYYTVQPGDFSLDLDYTNINALCLNGGSITTYGTTTNAVITLPTPGGPGSLGQKNDIVIDTIAPTAISISGQKIIPAKSDMVLSAVNGPLREDSWFGLLEEIQANTGTGSYWITGVSASDLTVIPSIDGATAVLHNDSTTPALIMADFVIPAACVVDKAGNAAKSNMIIDSFVSTSVMKVNAINGDGYYRAGEVIEITVSFSDRVVVTGTPVLHLETGAIDRNAVYSGGSGTDIISFVYTIMSQDTSPDLDYIDTTALDLYGGTIRDKVNLTNASLILPSPGGPGSLGKTKNLIIDTIAPNGISISSENVIPGNGSVTLTAIGGPLADDSWKQVLDEIKENTGSGGNWITGVSAGDLEITPQDDGSIAQLSNRNHAPAEVTADFVIPAAKIWDKAGNISLGNVTIDSFAKVNIVKVSSTNANGFYKAGSTIAINVIFDGEVTVTGTPTLCLETGTIDRSANYSGGSGTTGLTFSYLVQSGDTSTDLEYAGINALEGMIMVKGKASHADLTLPLPGGVGSLGQAHDITIDTTPPAAIHISTQNRIPGYGNTVFTAVEGPLSNASWLNILSRIKSNTSNTINGNWIVGIRSTKLTITIASDGASATLNNTDSADAIIVKDFIIPSTDVADKAGNPAAGDITINACSS
ncbi:MAG: hypothetical protein GX434_03480 [Peptococcaceae bacterium]|nr:hypothetical protein [Peptococcaceae bacterium]